MIPYRQSPSMAPVDPDEALAREVVRGELFEGERLLWAQRPKRGVTFLSDDVRTTIFMLMWTAFSCFWIFLVASAHEWGMALFGIPFVGVGLYQLIARPFVEASERERIFYAITDRRVLVVTTRPRTVKQHAIDRIPTTAAMATSSGYGSIWLDVPSYIGGNGQRKTRLPVLHLVPNVAEVHRILRQAMDGGGWHE